MSDQDAVVPIVNDRARLVVPGWVARLALILPLAALLTSVYIQHSMSVGRLAWGFPVYDDVSYFDDALERLDIFYREGPVGLLKHHWEQPPHSPWSSYAALTGYAVFGRTLWAPYAVNSILLLIAFLVIDRVAGPARLWVVLLLTALFWALPFSCGLIIECRPDAFCGLVSAYALFLMSKTPLTEWTTKEARRIGVLWGLTTWIKPTVFAQTGLFCVGALGWWWLLAMRESPRPWRLLFRNSAWLAGIATLIALPHLGVNLLKYIRYMIVNQFGDHRHLWTTAGDLNLHFWYYTCGTAGRLMFGGAFLSALGCVLITLLTAVGQRKRKLARELTTLLVLCFMCWLIPTLNDIKTAFFGLTFGALMLLTLVRSLAAWLNQELVLPRRAGLALGGAASAYLLLGAVISKGYWPIHSHSGGREHEVAQAFFDALAKQVEGARDGRRASQVRVALPFTGSINLNLVSWQFRMHQWPRPMIKECFLGDSLPSSFKVFRHADLVVVPEPGINRLLVSPRFIPESIHEQLISELSNDPAYRQCASVGTPEGKRFLMYVRERDSGIATARSPGKSDVE